MRAFSLHVWHLLSMLCSSTALVEMRHRSSTFKNLPTHRCCALWRILKISLLGVVDQVSREDAKKGGAQSAALG
jgi:hypothetical protein